MLSSTVRLALEKSQVLALRAGGATLDDIAYQYDTHPNTVSKMLKQWEKKNDLAKPATKQQQRAGGHASAKIRSLRANVHDLVEMRDAGLTLKDIAKRVMTYPSTIRTVLREYDQKKALAEAGKLEPGKKYGDLIFERIVHGKARLYLFRHKRGWRETFTEWQWKERTV